MFVVFFNTAKQYIFNGDYEIFYIIVLKFVFKLIQLTSVSSFPYKFINEWTYNLIQLLG